MRQDVQIKKNDDGLFDLQVSGGDFASVDGFEAAILVSMFSDARAPDSSVSVAKYRRGWVGDILNASIGRALGSTLWLYDQSRLTQSILNELTIAAQDCLDWMVQDGICKSVKAQVTSQANRGIVVLVDIVTLGGKSQRYDVMWRATSAANI